MLQNDRIIVSFVLWAPFLESWIVFEKQFRSSLSLPSMFPRWILIKSSEVEWKSESIDT